MTTSSSSRLNAPASDFRALKPHGERSFADGKGKWPMLLSHLPWTQSIKEKFGVAILFPIIEEIKMEVAGAYGMVHPGAADTQAVRATSDGWKPGDDVIVPAPKTPEDMVKRATEGWNSVECYFSTKKP